ncbi:hypothetical protein [Streptomyces himalayensis]|uniref:Uncharacterized protein n=1 Tax=Streptomyces himalayensis subsp. himalayensis TaxID=2756131 RepID=A0A7W0DQ12_9ACTN|nr:hypothetical protein [Streptomyces himalayensis]MBA2949105.1 hypothetical protein [Streptomyces himalayensis subsp. himalayensis]
MPTVIAVTSPDLVLPPEDQQTPPAVPLQSPDAQPLEHALADMQTLIDQHGYVIVVYSAATPTPMQHRLHTVRSILETDRIALFRSDLPPLGLAVLVRQLRQLSLCDLTAGVVASAARLLTHYIHAGALLNSVARLDRVPVGLKSHAKSWVPGSQFGVVANPAPQLVKIGPGAALAGPEFGTWLLVARGQLESDWVKDTLARSWQVQGVREAVLPAESARWWGTSKLIEFATYLPDLSILYQLVTSVRRDRCHWCALELIGDRCVFCSATLPAPENQTPSRDVLNHEALARQE